MTPTTSRSDLAGLLRAWRDRLQPAAVGFPAGQRRTRGLRREEVALLAGLSVDYLVRLEQGRAARPSAQVVSALARVLQLSDPERDQLYAAAGLAAPTSGLVPTHIPGSVQRLLARLPDVAVAVYTATWTLLTGNDAWSALLGPVDPGRNLVVQQFTGTGVRVLRGADDERRFERALVSDVRRAVIRYPDDPAVADLVERLRTASATFRDLWADATIVEHRSEPKTFVHPLVGHVTLDCDVFTAAGTDLRIVAYTVVPGSEDASRFDLLRTLGAEQDPSWQPAPPVGQGQSGRRTPRAQSGPEVAAPGERAPAGSGRPSEQPSPGRGSADEPPAAREGGRPRGGAPERWRGDGNYSGMFV